MKPHILKQGVVLILGVTFSACNSASADHPIAGAFTPSPTPAVIKTFTPLPTSTVTESSLPIPTASVSAFQAGTVLGKLMEYAIAPAAIDLEDCEDSQPILSFVYGNLWLRTRSDGGTLLQTPTLAFTEINHFLKSVGYHLEDRLNENSCVLYKGGQILREWSWPCDMIYISFNHSGTDFIMLIPSEYFGGTNTWLVRRDFMDEAWDFSAHFWVIPQYVGDDFFSLHDTIYEDIPREMRVERNGQVVYTLPLQGTDDCIGQGLMVWEDKHWGVNIEGDIVIDGEGISPKLGYSKAFGLRVLNDKPIFFFEKDHRVGVVYDGQALPLEYAEVQHECHPVYADGPCNHPGIGISSNRIWYFARKQDMWYYAELDLSE